MTERCVLESTGGPIEHVRVVCVRRHWFLMSTGTLAAASRPAEPRSPRRGPTRAR